MCANQGTYVDAASCTHMSAYVRMYACTYVHTVCIHVYIHTHWYVVWGYMHVSGCTCVASELQVFTLLQLSSIFIPFNLCMCVNTIRVYFVPAAFGALLACIVVANVYIVYTAGPMSHQLEVDVSMCTHILVLLNIHAMCRYIGVYIRTYIHIKCINILYMYVVMKVHEYLCRSTYVCMCSFHMYVRMYSEFSLTHHCFIRQTH